MSDTPLLPRYITEIVSKASLEQRKAFISLIEECEDAVNPYLTADNDSSSEDEPEPSHPNAPTVCSHTNQVSQFVVHKVLEIVNNHHSTSGDMNVCLVSCMSSKDSSLSYHSDQENMIDQSSDICTVSFGPARTLDFIAKDYNHGGRKGTPLPPQFSVPATNHSMNIMKAGCQSHLLHRVTPDTAGGVRYTLSFRKVLSLPPANEPDPHGTSLSVTTDVTTAPSTYKLKKKSVLLVGDSYFEGLDVDKLGKSKQSVCKVAKGGRKINDVLQSLKEFSADNPQLDVTKLFICVGTNDIRNCHERGVFHLKTPLEGLFSMAK